MNGVKNGGDGFMSISQQRVSSYYAPLPMLLAVLVL